MDITTRRAEGAAVVGLSGRLDVPAALGLRDKLRAEIEGERNVLFDLESLEFITSVGIRELIAFTKDVMHGGGRVFLCRVHPDVARVLEVTGLLGLFRIFSSESEALAALGGERRAA